LYYSFYLLVLVVVVFCVYMCWCCVYTRIKIYINRTQAAERSDKCRFALVTLTFDLWPLTLTFKRVRARDQTRIPVNLAQIRSAIPEIFHIHKQKSHTAPKTQFTACGKKWLWTLLKICHPPPPVYGGGRSPTSDFPKDERTATVRGMHYRGLLSLKTA